MALTPVQIGDLRDALGTGTQSFVDQSALISVPNTTIVNRAQIPNIASDLRPSFGIERIAIQAIQQIQNEFGPNGEIVWGTPNDTNGLIRFAGAGWSGSVSVSDGAFVSTPNAGDFLEITFFGTGLNLLAFPHGTQLNNATLTVDGGSPSTIVLTSASESGVLQSRNYAANKVVNIVSGLSLSIHTIKLQQLTNFLDLTGYEVLNTNSTTSLNINPGTSYVSGSKIAPQTVQTTSYNSGFTNTFGTPGTKGGRVLAYLAADGTVKKDIQYVDTAQNNLSSATHTNEEVVRTYFPREFGAGRSDDFSLGTSSSDRVFTLDDGTTTLNGHSVGMNNGGNNIEGIFLSTPSTSFVIITFVGTGLDITRFDQGAGTSDTVTVTIDGTNVGSLSTVASTAKRQVKIVSGLPYGSHSVKLFSSSAGSFSVSILSFIVYQAKKPTLPSSAIELADYNLMANFVANTNGTDNLHLSTGVLRKMSTREFSYTGTWVFNGGARPTLVGSGFLMETSTNGDFLEYTFVGTGFDARFFNTNGSNGTLSVDGVTNLSLFTTSVYGASFTYSSTTGAFSGTSADLECGITVSGLTFGKHTIRLTQGASGRLSVNEIDIITPIHSVRSNLYADFQNTLPIGSCAVSDNRQITPIKNQLPITKALAQAVGLSGNVTNANTSFVPMPDMLLTLKTNGGPLLVAWSIVAGSGTGNTYFTTYIDGVEAPQAGDGVYLNNSTSNPLSAARFFIIPLSSGVHTIAIYWKVSAGTSTVYNDGTTNRILTVREL